MHQAPLVLPTALEVAGASGQQAVVDKGLGVPLDRVEEFEQVQGHRVLLPGEVEQPVRVRVQVQVGQAAPQLLLRRRQARPVTVGDGVIASERSRCQKERQRAFAAVKFTLKLCNESSVTREKR